LEWFRRDAISDARSRALNAFGLMTGETGGLFATRGQDRAIMKFVRLWAELPDERSPRAFALRLAQPLVPTVALLLVAYFFRRDERVWPLCLFLGIFTTVLTLRIIWKKFRLVQRFRQRMRLGLGAMYNGKITYEEIDLASDPSPTLLKYSADLEAMGATHI